MEKMVCLLYLFGPDYNNQLQSLGETADLCSSCLVAIYITDFIATRFYDTNTATVYTL